MPCAIKTAAAAFTEEEAWPRLVRAAAAERANLPLLGRERPRFIADSTQTDPECVLGDEGPVTTKEQPG